MDPRVSQVIRILVHYVSCLSQQVRVRSGKPFQSAKDLTPEKLALSVNLSETRFRALFKSETGRTPAQYLKMLKMEKAREMACKTHLKATEILTILNVGDQSHFKRDFKKEYGVCLTKYRKQCRSAGK